VAALIICKQTATFEMSRIHSRRLSCARDMRMR